VANAEGVSRERAYFSHWPLSRPHFVRAPSPRFAGRGERQQASRGTILEFIFVLIVGLLAGAISGILGTGSSIMLVPVLVWQFGPKEAVPIMAVAAIIGNFSRILAWWREVDWRATFAYSATAAPSAALGAKTLLVLPSRAVDLAIAVFLLAVIPGRR